MAELESYVTNTKEFNLDTSIIVPASCEIIAAANIDNIPGSVNVPGPSFSYQEGLENIVQRDCRAQIEPQNHFLADVPELTDAWPLESPQHDHSM